MGGTDFAPVAAEIGVAQVVGQDDNHVGSRVFCANVFEKGKRLNEGQYQGVERVPAADQ